MSPMTAMQTNITERPLHSPILGALSAKMQDLSRREFVFPAPPPASRAEVLKNENQLRIKRSICREFSEISDKRPDFENFGSHAEVLICGEFSEISDKRPDIEGLGSRQRS